MSKTTNFSNAIKKKTPFAADDLLPPRPAPARPHLSAHLLLSCLRERVGLREVSDKP